MNDDVGDPAPSAIMQPLREHLAPLTDWMPPEVRDRRLAAYGERLYRSITAAAPGATWVMQGWLFGADKHFWTPDAIAAFLSRVPDKGMLILDIGNDRYPGVWRDTTAFDDASWKPPAAPRFFLFLPRRNWMSISAPLTRTSSQRR